MFSIKALFSTVILSLAFAFTANSQLITGKVLDENGTPVESVSVLIKGTSTGAVTDAQGQFSITAKVGDVLLFTSAGYDSREVQIKNAEPLSVVMAHNIEQLDQIVMLGSRGEGRVKLASPVPVDVINMASSAQTSARPDITALLNYTVPSFNFNRQSGSDGADQIDLATLRGLGPDQTLVLVNGKRRHQTAFVAIFGSRGRGNSGTDLNAIPEAAIDRVEILRDGASAQYGSDAIAGVINIILKQQTSEWQFDLGGSGYYDRKYNPYFAKDLHNQYIYGDAIDGKVFNFDVNKGFALGKSKKGFINLTGNYFVQGKTYRQVLDTNLNHKDALPINVGRRAVGDASGYHAGGMINMAVPIANTQTTFYSFGGYNYKSSDAYAYTRRWSDTHGRFPTVGADELIWDPKYMVSVPVPNDVPDTVFNPHIQNHITDYSLAVGFKGLVGNGWHWDISNTVGKNDFHFFGDKTYNASLGAAGINKNHFDDGGFSFLQNTSNFDINKSYPNVANGMVLSAGAEFRYEQYKIYAGEEGSYHNYDIADDKASGSQGFPGFQPVDVVNARRYSEGLYLQADIDITDKWLSSGAVRGEHYNDFGSLATFKYSTRYKLSPKVNLRGSVSTGFRAPSLQQINFSNTFTNFQGGVSFDVKLAPNYSAITKAAGIPNLKQEKSVNVSLGFTARPLEDFSVTLDGYMVRIKDRVVLSGEFDDQIAALTSILHELRVSEAQFFANAVNTTNVGVDINLNYAKSWGSKSLTISLAGNIQHMKINKINVPPALNNSYEDRQSFFSDREQKFVLASAPPEKIDLTVDYGASAKFKFGGHLTYFGKIVLLGYGWENTYPPTVALDHDPSVTVPEQFNYFGKLVTDIYASYKIFSNTTLFAGADNLFNVHPNLGYVPGAKLESYDGETGGAWDPVQMGFNGLRLFLKARINLK